MRLLCPRVVVLVLGLALLGGTARGQDRARGPYKFDLKFGPSIGVLDSPRSTQIRVEMHLGIGLDSGYRYRIYLDLPAGFGFGAGYTTIALIPGIEADIALMAGTPLYLYPMVGVGMGLLVPSCGGNPNCKTNVALGIRFGVGLKYVINGRWNFFFEPFNLEFYPAGSQGYTAGFYNLLFGMGVNF